MRVGVKGVCKVLVGSGMRVGVVVWEVCKGV